MARTLQFKTLPIPQKKEPVAPGEDFWKDKVEIMQRYFPLTLPANAYAMMLMEATSIMDFGVRAAPEVFFREMCPDDGIHEGFLIPFPYLGDSDYSCHIDLLDINYADLPVPVLGYHNKYIYTMLTDMEKDMGVKYSLVTENTTRTKIMEFMHELGTLNTETLLIFNMCVNLALSAWADDYLPLA